MILTLVAVSNPIDHERRQGGRNDSTGVAAVSERLPAGVERRGCTHCACSEHRDPAQAPAAHVHGPADVTAGIRRHPRGVLLATTEGFPIRLKTPDPVLQSLDFQWLGIPGPFFWFLGLVIIFSYVLTRTRFGNWLFATGGSPEAARGMGVPAARVQITAFAIASMLACVAGYVSVARFSSVDALRGTGMELEVVLAVVIGGASLNGGYGSIIGAGLGVLIIGMIQQGLILIGISVYWYQAGIGMLLIVAATINQRVRKRSIS